MKILSIKGKNLASLEGEFSIDFRSEPLRSAGIFAITGNTGSGKTTLLDAMCIALFHQSPRTYKAKTDKSSEREDEEIKENDCRSILRRGTGECYALVEFLALNGKEYSSRWSVSRARNKANGNIQPAKYELTCISDNQFISKNKKEIEETIVGLIGLNYEQFTRAVLLAQGEFSAFLKASSNEKADILEKLTGTEIYARISERIYEKSKEADNALCLINERLKEIPLLTPEECTQLEEEKYNLKKATEKDEEALSVINEKLKWIERLLLLEQEKEKAQKNVELCAATIEGMSEIIKTVEQREYIQPISDIYTESKRIKRKIAEEKSRAEALSIQYNKEKEEYSASEKLLEECKAEKENIEKEKSRTEPLIIEATKIETDRNNSSARLQESENLLAQATKQLTLCNEQRDRSSCIIKHNKKEQEEIKLWLEEKAMYSDIISRCEIISTNIADAKDALSQIEQKSTMLRKSLQQQLLFEQHLSAAKEEAEKLKATLSLEIATLRTQLVDGEPCPVCGSRHHCTTPKAENTLNEKELTKARKENEENISRLTGNIEKTKTEAASLSSSIEGYKKIYSSRIANLLSIMSKLLQNINAGSEKEDITYIEKIAVQIEQIAKEWTEKSNRIALLQQQTALERNTLANTESKIEELQTIIQTNKESIENLRKHIALCNEQITAILGSAKSVSEISDYFRREIERCGKEFSQRTLHRNNMLVSLTKTGQEIKTLQQSIDERKKRAVELCNEIEKFLTENGDKIERQHFETLAEISVEEYMQMRRHIAAAKENLLQARTQLEERTRNIEQHTLSTVRPTGDESKESLCTIEQELKVQTTQRIERITQITVKLNSDKEYKIRTEKIREEHKEAESYATDWKRLCEIFGSAKGQKFRMIAQGYTLDIMLSYANIHLKQLSSRYQLVRSAPDSLALMIIDLDMLSERRTVNTLSGGETFLVSLALALALSSLSSSNMNIESLFIDEGFGSLDSDTLRIAMEALENLQSQGRKIGVISHLSNMIERIPTQICVSKRRGGKSSIQIKQQP